MEDGPSRLALGKVAGLVARNGRLIAEKNRAAVPGTTALGVVLLQSPGRAENPAGEIELQKALLSIFTDKVVLLSSFLPLASFFPDFTGFDVSATLSPCS
jgi:hypothetical protein